MIKITPYPKNQKKHPKKQVEQVANSIKEFGMNQPIVVDKNGVIIVGHGRYEALKLLKWEIKPEYIKVVDLTEEQAKAYRLADNKLNESEWDMALVIEELKGLSEPMLELTGFDKDLIIEPDEKDDEVPEVPVEPQSKLGDLYELGNHRVLCGDSTKIEDVERLMDGKKADMVFTDPPYGVDYDGGVIHGNKINTNHKRDKLDNDDIDIYGEFMPLLKSFVNGAVYIFYATRYSHEIFKALRDNQIDVMAVIAWIKTNTGYADMNSHYKNRYEPFVYCKIGDKTNFIGDTSENTTWEIDKDRNNKLHPTQKPISLATRAIKNHKADLVLDLFLGSGSTLIASEKTNRRCYGMELDPKYVDVIVQRYVDYTGNSGIIKNGKKIIWQDQ